MATEYYVDPTNGNDANSGLSTALPKLTILNAFNTAATGDKINLRSGLGNHALAANLSNSTKIILMQTYAPDIAGSGKAIITGAFSIGSGSGGAFEFSNIEFKNNASGTASTITCSGSFARLDKCDITMNKTGSANVTTGVINVQSSGAVSLIDVNITNTGSPDQSAITSATNGCTMRNVKIKNFNNGVFLNGVTNLNMQGCFLIDLDSVLRAATGSNITNSSLILEYNIFSRIAAAFINNATAGAAISNPSCLIRRNYIDAPDAILNSSTSTLTVLQNLNEYNIWATGASFTDFNSNGDTTTSTPEFYNATGDDYRIEIDSPLSSLGGDTVGALVPDWDSFWSSVPEADVRLGEDYRDRSRVVNKTGSAAIPIAADVRLGTAVDATTGTLEVTGGVVKQSFNQTLLKGLMQLHGKC